MNIKEPATPEPIEEAKVPEKVDGEPDKVEEQPEKAEEPEAKDEEPKEKVEEHEEKSKDEPKKVWWTSLFWDKIAFKFLLKSIFRSESICKTFCYCSLSEIQEVCVQETLIQLWQERSPGWKGNHNRA